MNELKPIYIFIGIPRSGKDTQAVILSKKLGLPHLDIGKMLLEIISLKEPGWEELAETYSKGPVPTDLVFKLLALRLQKPEYQKGFVLSQNTKSVEEAKLFRNLFNENQFEIKQVFHLEVSKKVAFDRALAILTNEQNIKEPNVETILTRINNYSEIILPIVDYYRSEGLLLSLDGEETPEKIAEHIYQNI